MRKIFSTILFATTIIALFGSVSCKKDGNSNPSGYYMKFKLDGNDKQYTQITTAVFTELSPFYTANFAGENIASGTTYEGMGIFLFDDSPIAANITYTDEDVTVSGQSTTQAALLFNDTDGTQFSSAVATSPAVKVTITSIDATSVTGTFSGTIAGVIDNSKSHVVTEGSFHLKKQ